MPIEVRMNWTANQWRRFFGQPDTTPLIELTSIIVDKIALLAIDKRLSVLRTDVEEHGRGPIERQNGAA